MEPMVTSKPIVTKAPVKEQPKQERLRGVWGKKKALSQRLIALTMISSDVVLALMFWEIAALVQGIWGAR